MLARLFISIVCLTRVLQNGELKEKEKEIENKKRQKHTSKVEKRMLKRFSEGIRRFKT
ncbi:MAG: hypothetical protein Q7J67_05035 [bacterium]|nr:hypothetical protein [bacterium]